MKLHSTDGSELMDIAKLESSREGLIVSGNMMGAMPIEAVLKPAELRQIFKLLNVRIVLHLIKMIFSK